MTSYKLQWEEEIRRQQPGFEYADSVDPYERFAFEGGEVVSASQDYLRRVILTSICPDMTSAFRASFLNKAISCAERVQAEHRYNPHKAMGGRELSQQGFERHGRAVICQVLAYGRAFANNANLDHELLTEASEGFEFSALSSTPANWDEPAQWEYHDAVFSALAIADVDRAVRLMNVKKSFKWTKAMHDALSVLVNNIAKAPGHRLDPESTEGRVFQAFFDDIRDPDIAVIVQKYGKTVGNKTWAAFHLALVKERFVTGNAGAPDWRRVFDSIAE